MSNLTLYTKLETLPPELKTEVHNFIDFLIEKTKKSQSSITPKFGSAKGKIRMSKDFDKPLDSFNDYM
jgi:hypothetical protein